MDDLRISDADREAAAAELREHYAAGRITDSELSERLDAAYAAKTSSELVAVRADLPDPQAPKTRRELARRRFYHDAGAIALIDAACVAVWLATGAGGSFWPIWVILVTAFRLAQDGWRLLGPAADQMPPEYRTWVERREERRIARRAQRLERREQRRLHR